MITKRYDTTIELLRANDCIVAGNGIITKYHGTVAAIDKKAKWATLTFEDGRKARLEMTLAVTVERQEKDDAEKEADRRNYLAECVMHEFTRGTKSTPADYVRDCLATNATQVVSHALSYHQIDSLLHIQAKYAVWMEFDGMRMMYTEAGVAEDIAIIAAFDYATENRRRGFGGRDPLSRSTSVMSNINDDLVNWAPAELRESSAFGWDRSTNAALVAAARKTAEDTLRAARTNN